MKRKRKFLLSFMLCVMGIFAFGTTAYAKAQLVELKVYKTYRTDVNGDGKKDRLKIVEKKDATYIQIFDNDKSGEYRKICELIITYGTTVIKVLPEERIDATNLVNRIKCQMRKYQFCIRCSACDSTCPHGAIDTIHGKYTIDENKCQHCKHCIAKFYNGCIMCDVLSSKKGSQ